MKRMAAANPSLNGRARPSPAAGVGGFANYRCEDPHGDGVPVKSGLSAGEIASRLSGLSGGWPKRVGPRLFAAEADCKPLWLETADGLFAWIGRKLPAGEANSLRWVHGEDKVSQGQFYAHLKQTVETFNAIESAPHFPPMDGCFYMHPEAKGGDGKAPQAPGRL